MKKGGNPQNLLRGGKPGHKGGSGRPPDWLTDHCKGLVGEKKLVQRLAKIAAGDPVVPAMGAFGPIRVKGKQVYVAAPVKVQVDAIKELLDRGFGKSVQQIGSSSFDEIIEMMRKKYA